MPDYRQSLPQYSLQRLFTGFTFAALGLGINAWALRSTYYHHNTWLPSGLVVLLVLASGPMIGMGLLHPFKRPVAGFVIGSLLSGMFYFALVAVAFRHG